MESGETAEVVEGKTEKTSDSERQESRHYEKAEQEADYNSEPVQSRYTKSAGGAKESGKKENKKLTKGGGLGELVNRLTKEAKIDDTEYLNAHLHENIHHYLEESDDSGEEGTKEGVFAIIYNKETGEFLLGARPSSYFKKYRGKLSSIGGGIEPTDFSPLEAQAREMDEEVEDMEAKKILKRELRINGVYLGEMADSFYGEIFKTHWYAIPVPIQVWDKVKKTRLVSDAGTTYIGTFDDILSRRDNDFVFDNGSHGKKLKEFISENLFSDKDFLKRYKYSNSTMPIVTTNHGHLQTIENSFNRSLISMDKSLMPTLTFNYQNKTPSIQKPLYTH